ncbi:protein mono-ADP-ribosyltransferase PARP14-like [Saccostrea echinata]|uniref:protein mono-ADP-ribosyltransferase PARP14-like n=1 Tax=Saccostrea echinata TaxID=191078 RepID=UPI002A82ED0A|nr:protein mono-ADP-ribosyltransferase PARP14-like [Saccostrea echinata]
MSDSEEEKQSERMSVRDKIKAFESKTPSMNQASSNVHGPQNPQSELSSATTCMPSKSSTVQDSDEGTSVDHEKSESATGRFLTDDTSSTEEEGDIKETDPTTSENPSGRFLIDDTSSMEDEEEDKETDSLKDNQGNVSSDDSEIFEDARQHEEASTEPPMKLTITDQTTSQNSEGSGSPSTPEAVWSPPTFSSEPSTTNQTPHSEVQEVPVQIPPTVPPKLKETTPTGKMISDRTVYQNWDPDDEAQGDGFSEPKKPDKKEEAPINRTVYQNWEPETESVPPKVPERSYRKDAPPPIPPKSFRSIAPTPESAVFGSDEYQSVRSTAGNINQSNVATHPTLPEQSPTVQQSNTSIEEQAPALPPKPPISDFEANPQSLPPKMEYPHTPYPSYPYTSMPGGMPSYGNPYVQGQQDFDPSLWGITKEMLQNPGYMQQFMYWQQYCYSQQQQQQYSKGAPPSKAPSGPTPGGDSVKPGQDKEIPVPKGHGHTTPNLQSKTKPATEHKPPKPEPKKKEKKPPKKLPTGNVEKETKPVPKQNEQTPVDLFVCVSGLHPGTKEETLTNFLEARASGDVEVESVVYNEGNTTAIVQFDSPVDAEKLNDASKKKKLEGKGIEISAIDPVKLIVVSAEGEVTDAKLKQYFQNKERSGGGEVQRVTSRNDGCFTVKFKHEEDALQVCKKLDHEVSNTPLVVTPMFFTDQGEIYDSSKHTVPIPEAFTIDDVDLHVQRYLQQSNPVLERLNSELEKKHAKVIIKTEEIQVDCLLNQKTQNVRQLIKSWKTDVKEIFDDYVRESIHKTEIEVTEDAWNEVEEYMTTTHTHSPESILTVYEKDSLKIVLVGEKMLVQEVHIQTSNQHKAIESKIERKKQIILEERECCAPNIRLLERLGIITEVNGIREDLDVDTDSSNGKILFKGVREDILEARVKIEEKLSQFERWTISQELSKYQILLLGTEPGQFNLQKEFESKGLTVEMEFQDDSIRVYAIDSSQKSIANKIILDMTKESVIALDETSLNVLSTEKWEYEVMKMQSEYYEKVMISPANDAKITVTAFSDLHDYIKTKLEDFIKENSIYTDIVDIEDEGVMKFIGKHCSKQLNDIQANLSQHFVKLDVQNKQIMIEGTKEGLSQAKSDVMDMIGDIHHVMKTYVQPGINKVLRTDQEQLIEIEDRCHSVIMFTGPKQPDFTFKAEPVRTKRRIIPEIEEMLRSSIFSERPRPVPTPRIQTGPYCCAESNIIIRLVRGELAKQQGDVIVCSVAQDLQLKKGKSSRNLLEEGGQGLMAEVETKYPNGIQTGELAIIGGGNLRCKELYLGYLPNWGSTHGKILVEFMNKCLRTAHDSSYHSIVFAALGTGQLGYPKDQVAEMMYQTVIDFDRKCAGTQVKEVKFICYHGDLETCEAFEAEEKHRLNPHLPKTKIKASRKGPYITKSKMKVSIVKSEIGKHSADVLVVACEKSLNLSSSGKAAKSLLASGGNLLQEGAKVKYPNGIANYGDFASIPGAGLNCQEVYLTAIPGEEEKSQTTLCKFVADCMKHADQSGYSSIAFAAMGTGSMKYSATEVAKNFYHEVKKYSNNHPNSNVKHVQFVLHPADAKTIKAFEDHEMQLLNKTVYSSGSGAYTTASHGIVVTVKTASITKLKDDVIVVSAHPDLDLSRTQVTQAVMKEGGSKIQQDLRGSYPNGIKVGDLAIVTAGNLPCKEVYIMTLPKYNEDPKTAEKHLKDLVVKCLTVGNQKGHSSISFPCLGTGYNGYPHIQAADLLFEAVTEFDRKVSSTNIKTVNFVAISSDRKSLGAFQSEEKKFCSQQAQPSLDQSILGQSVNLSSLGSSMAAGATSFARGVMTRASRMFKSEEEEETSDVIARHGQKPNEVVIGQLTISVSAGDLTEQKVDAIVNSTNLELDFTQGGVSAALVKKCGKQLETECAAKKKEMKDKKMIVTSGCGLGNIKHIIHIECQDTIKKWKDVVNRTLQMADNSQCTTIAFPVLGTGKGFVTFKPEAIGEMFVDSVSEFLSQNGQSKITMVKIVAFQEEMVTPMSTAMRDACGKSKSTGMLDKLSDLASNVGLAPQRGLASSTVVVEDQSVTLWIYGETKGARDDTIEEISKFIKSQSTKAKIEDVTLLPNLKPNELDKIKKVSDQHDVKMSIEQQRGVIMIEGLTEEVANAKDKIHELLRHFQKERWLDEEAKLVADTVQWSVMVKDQMTGIDKLEDYPERQNMYLENAYKKKQNIVKLKAVDGDIIVDLTTMKEYPADDPTQTDNVVRKEKATGNKIELPAHWTVMKDNENIKVVTLLPSSTEYQDIEKRFLSGVKTGIYNTGNAPNPLNNPVGQFNNVKVNKIERIQNPSLYQQYAAKLDHIEKHVDQKTTKLVQDLWHGAAPAAIVSINYYGFNRSYCGNNAGEPWYGQGVYFASDASYSARDWLSGKDPSGKKKMYQAKVITGHYCRGQKGMRYLPERMVGVNYDCAVNDLNNPTEFVIFNDTQAYPEYCIEFTI